MKIYLPLDRCVRRFSAGERSCVVGAQYHLDRLATPDDGMDSHRGIALRAATLECYGLAATDINDDTTLPAHERTMLLQLAILAAGHEPVIVER